jgi:hypothetical protein
MRAHRPSETNRAKVIALVTNGARQDRIAEHLEIDAKTLRKHYARELEFGTETLLSKVLNNLASIACRGRGLPAVAAAKYLLSCRGGYQEKFGVEPSVGPGDCPAGKSPREIILARLAAMSDTREKLQ